MHTIWLALPWGLLLLSFSFITPTCQGAFLCLLQSPYLVVTLSPVQIISAHLPWSLSAGTANLSHSSSPEGVSNTFLSGELEFRLNYLGSWEMAFRTAFWSCMLGLEGVSEHEAYRYGDHASETTLEFKHSAPLFTTACLPLACMCVAVALGQKIWRLHS